MFDFHGYTASFYTAAASLGDDQGPAPGYIAGGPVPSGTIDTAAGTIALDIRSLFVNQMDTDVNVAPVGGVPVMGSWDALTQSYRLQWDGYFPGPGFGAYWQFELTGFATPVPGPVGPMLWLAGLGLVLARGHHKSGALGRR